MAADSIFLDTSVIVAASVDVHPAHGAALAAVTERIAAGAQLCQSPQVCRELLVVLTRQPVSGRVISVPEALAVLDGWRSHCLLLDENLATIERLRELVERHDVKGKQAHDANVVAVMLAHGVTRLLTRNGRDFARYDEIESLDA